MAETIIIDKSEPKSVFDAFDKCRIPFKTERLDVGDFCNDKGTFIAERKGFHDFWASLCDRRLYNQIARMYEQYDSNRYLFVEVGSLADLAEEKRKNINWIYSLFGEAENWKVNFREYIDLEDLARKLYSLDKKLGTERKKRNKEVRIYNTFPAVRSLMQYDSVGQKKAEDMLKSCGNFRLIVDNLFGDQEKLNSVKGIKKGGKILEKMKKEMTRKFK